MGMVRFGGGGGGGGDAGGVYLICISFSGWRENKRGCKAATEKFESSDRSSPALNFIHFECHISTLDSNFNKLLRTSSGLPENTR